MSRHPHRATPAIAVAVAATVLLAGCSSSGTGSPAVIGAAVQAQLRADVRAVTTAVAAHQPRQARAALARLNTDSSAAHTAGTLSDTAFARIRAAAIQLSSDLNHVTAGRTPTTTVPTGHHNPGKGDGKHRHGDGGDN